MRGKNKKGNRLMWGDDDSDFYEEELTIVGRMSPVGSLSKSAPLGFCHVAMSADVRPPKALKARNERQAQYLRLLESKDVPIVVATGSSGTGKTYIASAFAMEHLQAGDFRKIILTRPMVGVDDKHFGALPGDVLAKMSPWTQCIMDTLCKYVTPAQFQNMISKGTAEVCAITHMRGRSFENCYIIADEMQNCTPTEMLMLLTRIGEGSKLVITGDPQQFDNGFQKNGLQDLLNRLKEAPQEGIGEVHFTEAEVVRHPIIKKILRLYHTRSVPS